MPAVTPWYQGTQVPLTWTSTDTTGTPFEAANAAVTVTAPDGTPATPTVTHQGAGVYKAVYTTTQAGHHLVAWTATVTGPPALADAFADTFEVQPAADGTIVSLAEAKEILKLTSTTAYDAAVQGHNAAITNWIEYVCGPVVQQTVLETIPAHGTEVILSKPPVLNLVAWTQVPPELANLGITVPVPPSPMIRTRLYGIEWPLTQLYVDPRKGIVTHTSGLPFYYCSYVWQYQAGRLVIPAGIYDATKIALKHLFAVERGGQAGGTQAGYGETETPTTDTGFGFAVPNRAVELLMPYSSPSRMVAA